MKTLDKNKMHHVVGGVPAIVEWTGIALEGTLSFIALCAALDSKYQSKIFVSAIALICGLDVAGRVYDRVMS